MLITVFYFVPKNIDNDASRIIDHCTIVDLAKIRVPVRRAYSYKISAHRWHNPNPAGGQKECDICPEIFPASFKN